MKPFEGVLRRASLCPPRPVTPEVAGSSPVAPVENTLQISTFCCRFWRKRPPARPPAVTVRRPPRSRARRGDGRAAVSVSARPRSRIQSRRYHCNFVDAANDRVLADIGLLVHDRSCHTRASADIAVMEEDGVSNLGPFLDDDPRTDYRTRDGSADVRSPSDEAAVDGR